MPPPAREAIHVAADRILPPGLVYGGVAAPPRSLAVVLDSKPALPYHRLD